MLNIALLALLAIILMPSQVSASVKVNVNTNTSINQSSTNTSDNNTHIRINSNGEVKEYNGSNDNVEIKSGDGKTTVSVKNIDGSNKSAASSDVNNNTNIFVNSNTKEGSPSSSPTSEATVAGIFIENEGKSQLNTGFWEQLIKKINAIFESIF